MKTIEIYEGVAVPAKYEVCPECNGEGVHDHPAFRNGWSMADFETYADYEDFAEEYHRGSYDVRCEECRGNRVVLVSDYECMDADTRELTEEYEQELALSRAEKAYRQRMGTWAY